MEKPIQCYPQPQFESQVTVKWIQMLGGQAKVLPPFYYFICRNPEDGKEAPELVYSGIDVGALKHQECSWQT